MALLFQAEQRSVIRQDGRPSKGESMLIYVMSPQTADQLLARADAAKALAEEAARKGNGTLQEANTILSNLKGKEQALAVNPSTPVRQVTWQRGILVRQMMLLQYLSVRWVLLAFFFPLKGKINVFSDWKSFI